ncbi:hypothetical protein PPYR_15001 [Photinus pyralis]|uniref:DDE-1 domain-containing protein n=1 Tax=Photinus pyralis TaxID=7054 RepID=A0A5N3ZYT8_PHOPY|nr:hypothetical protein PPYR_15444 [Photinus pyralis]KAB0790592.1 hypothetical protein PPYR_15001 [Photinus pyralis]
MMAKCFLEKGRIVPQFINNLPGKDWALSVLKRHKNSYGQRLVTNIEKARATVSKETVNNYFTNLEQTLKEIPSNIFNYDETNVSDDPGKKWGIYRRGVKYPEKICNHSKSATTIMVCRSVDGTLLPPCIIYKSIHLYDTWKQGGAVVSDDVGTIVQIVDG